MILECINISMIPLVEEKKKKAGRSINILTQVASVRGNFHIIQSFYILVCRGECIFRSVGVVFVCVCGLGST